MFNHRNKAINRLDRKKLFKPSDSQDSINNLNASISFLDYMSVEEFMQSVKKVTSESGQLSSSSSSSSNSTTASLHKLLYSVSSQLKGLRALLSLHSFLISNETTEDVLSKVLDTAKIIINAENMFILQLDRSQLDYVITHSNHEDILNLKIPVKTGGRKLIDST